jgi:hypothetical protein
MLGRSKEGVFVESMCCRFQQDGVKQSRNRYGPTLARSKPLDLVTALSTGEVAESPIAAA